MMDGQALDGSRIALKAMRIEANMSTASEWRGSIVYILFCLVSKFTRSITRSQD